MLKGQAKTNYQREYRLKGQVVRPSEITPVRPELDADGQPIPEM